MLSEVFWVAFITTMSGVIIKLASMAYKSKCKECSVCCIRVVRDTDLEASIEAKELEFRSKREERTKVSEEREEKEGKD